MFRNKPTVGSVCTGMCHTLPPRNILIRISSLWRSTLVHLITPEERNMCLNKHYEIPFVKVYVPLFLLPKQEPPPDGIEKTPMGSSP